MSNKGTAVSFLVMICISGISSDAAEENPYDKPGDMYDGDTATHMPEAPFMEAKQEREHWQEVIQDNLNISNPHNSLRDNAAEENPYDKPGDMYDGDTATHMPAAPFMEAKQEREHWQEVIQDNLNTSNPHNSLRDKKITEEDILLFILSASGACMLVIIFVFQGKRCTLRKSGFDLSRPDEFTAGKYKPVDFTQSTYRQIDIADIYPAEQTIEVQIVPDGEEIVIPAEKDVDVTEYFVMFKNKILRLIKELSRDNE